MEPEIAFLLARDIETPATVTCVLAATASVFAAVDVLDSRYEEFRFALPDVVADNASAGSFFSVRSLGGPVTWRTSGCSAVSYASTARSRDRGRSGDDGPPRGAVAWLANRLAQDGEQPRAGQLVFSGG